MSKAANPSTNTKKVALKSVVKDDVPAEVMQQCLNTALYELTRMHPFVGSTLQVMNIMYSYVVPTAGVTFNADMKRYEMYINPVFFCHSLNDKQRVAVLIHEMAHILNRHLIRVPFMKVSDHKRMLLNVAGDLAINQTIQNLPRGCSQCPPLEDQKQGATCENERCPGMCLDVADYYDEDETTGKKTPWPKNKTMELYFEKLMEMYEEQPEDPDTKNLLVSIATTEELDVSASGTKRGKTLTFNDLGKQTVDGRALSKDQNILVKDQTDARNNGVYVVNDEGSDQTSCVLTRLEAHDGGDQTGVVKCGDLAVPRYGAANVGKGFQINGEPGTVVDVDAEPMEWVESKSKSGGKGKGRPRQFDVHDWHANAEESEILDATEDLVKRAMVKQGLSYDDLPSTVKDLLDSIKSRRSELNYKALILSAIKRSASGHDRAFSWTRRSRRFGNKAPGTKEGHLPKLSLFLDTSGSISVEELCNFLDIVDEFLKVGSRKCELNLFSDTNYYTDKYRLADRAMQEKIKKSVSMGGTCLESSLKRIAESRPDLSIILTDGCYSDVDFESWLKPGQSMPQVLWVISKDGQENHPLARLGQTIKIPK
jgi:predicted metal-dependent peptidase